MRSETEFPATASPRGLPGTKLPASAVTRGFPVIFTAGMKVRAAQVFTIGVYVEVLAVLVQFFLAGLGIFYDAYAFFFHAVVNALIVGLLPLVLALVGWYAGLDRRTLLMTASIFLLVVLQSLLLAPTHIDGSGALRIISGLHVVNALAIFMLALNVMDRVRFPARA